VNRKKLKTVARHILFWVIYTIYENVATLISGVYTGLLASILPFIINAVDFYIFWGSYQFLERKISNKTLRIMAMTVATFALIIASAYSKGLMAMVMHYKWFPTMDSTERWVAMGSRAIYFGTMGVAYGFFKRTITKEREAAQLRLEKVKILQQQEKLEKQALQAELNVIKSQINPHFVFNTLGFLYSETYKKLPEVGDAIITLSNIMRHALTKNEDGFSTLESELGYIKDFIKIHASRSPAFFMKINIETVTAQYKVVSLILITLIENMFKHGIFNQSTKEAILNITINDGILHFYSLNYKGGNMMNKVESNGIGLSYIKERLTEEYGEDFELAVNETHNSYECKLTMPLKTV
jgi:sensor histidine kinase YesM